MMQNIGDRFATFQLSLPIIPTTRPLFPIVQHVALFYMLTVIFDTCELCKLLLYFCFLFPRSDHSWNIVSQGQEF